MNLYLINTRSNLHAGAGDNSFGIIDRHVQRDHTTDLPTIFGSSLKGALREAYLYQNGPVDTARLFGSDNRRGEAPHLQQGTLLISDAQLLSLPARSTHRLFFNATTPELLWDFLQRAGDIEFEGKEFLKTLRKKKITAGNPVVYGADPAANVFLETISNSATLEQSDKISSVSDLLGNRIALLHVDDFATLARELPVVARNSLDNGVSQNLWYEELVPHHARFYCTIADYGTKKMGTPETPISPAEALETSLATSNHFVQVGANATVGYGQTQWTKINK